MLNPYRNRKYCVCFFVLHSKEKTNLYLLVSTEIDAIVCGMCLLRTKRKKSVFFFVSNELIKLLSTSMRTLVVAIFKIIAVYSSNYFMSGKENDLFFASNTFYMGKIITLLLTMCQQYSAFSIKLVKGAIEQINDE